MPRDHPANVELPVGEDVASKRPRHVPRDHDGLDGRRVGVSRLQRGRGTCLGITIRPGCRCQKAGLASKRPRHVPRDHSATFMNLPFWPAASKRPRHVPRDHEIGRANPGKRKSGFKEAEARASGSRDFQGCACQAVGRFKEAEARASGSPRSGLFLEPTYLGFKEAEARASGSRRVHGDDGRNRVASKRPRHVPRDHMNSNFGVRLTFTASKRPRHVPRDHPSVERVPVDSRGLQRGRGTCLGIT